MITKFDGFKNDITFDEMRYSIKEQRDIQDYFFKKYPRKINILNSDGFINGVTLDITLKFAIKRKDKELIELIQKYKDKITEHKMKKDAKKFNL